MSKLAIIKEAATAWNHLQGIICVYKPLGVFPINVMREIKVKLSLDLNNMVCREPQTIVQLRRIEGGQVSTNSSLPAPDYPDPSKEIVARINDGPDTIEIYKGPSYADHPLVVGPRYQWKDVKIIQASHLGKDSSGVMLLGLMKEGNFAARRIRSSRWIRSYIVSGRFGTATDSRFHTGKIVEKSTYHNVKKYFLDRLLSSSQASHQRSMFQAAGVQLNSERAYELASQGLVRPDDNTDPIIYSLKCVKFDLPDFEIEVQAINEHEDYLKTLIHELGLRLRSTATCTKIRCVKYGPFNVSHALLKKHWDVENILDNISNSAKVLKTVDIFMRNPFVETDDISNVSPNVPY